MNDPKVQLVGFAEKTAVDADEKPGIVNTFLPSDFGSEGYGLRRRRAINKHIREIAQQADDLLWLFDYWRPCSEDLRQYRWAHHEKDVARARKLVEWLPPQMIFTVLRYLIDAYWDRYLGWPDLLLYRQGMFELIEVKSSQDKLNAKQKRWIADNATRLHFPFRLLKLHRMVPRGRTTPNKAA